MIAGRSDIVILSRYLNWRGTSMERVSDVYRE